MSNVRMACKCGCGESAATKDYSATCYQRWRRQGFPEGGPRPPLSRTECGLRSAEARESEPDTYDLQWAAGATERRVNRVRRQAAHLIQVVAARDAAGFARLLEKVTDPVPLLAVLAECADPVRTAIVCGPLMASAPRTPAPLGEGKDDDAAA